MKRHLLVAGILILTMLLGCSPKAPVPLSPTQETQVPTPSLTLEETPTPTQSPATQTTPSPAISTPTPTTTPTPSPTPTPPLTPTPYAGPLFDTHLHLASMYSTAQPSRLKSAADLFSYLDRNKVEEAISMYSLTTNKLRSLTAAKAEVIITGTRSRVIPLLQPEDSRFTAFASGQYNEAVLRQYLQPQGLLQGVGEIPLYWPELQSVTFDSPVMQTVFRVVNELKGIVMIHLANANNAQGGRPTELAEVEPSIRKYPDAIFLFHGQPECFNVVVQLMSKYSNVYFTLDATHGIFHPFNPKLMGYNLLYPTDASASNAESFLAAVNRIGSDRLVEECLKIWTPLLLQYPDRIMWGTDLNDSWHFEEPVTDVVISLSRQLIGRLPADI